MELIEKGKAIAAIERLLAQVGPGEADRGFAIEDCLDAVGKLEPVGAQEEAPDEEEQQVVDMLLRSGTASDMRILGVINRMRGEIAQRI